MRTGPSAVPLKKFAKDNHVPLQEEWFRYKVAAEALGGAAWDLAALPEPDRTYWYHRGLLLASCEAEAWEQDEIDRIAARKP